MRREEPLYLSERRAGGAASEGILVIHSVAGDKGFPCRETGWGLKTGVKNILRIPVSPVAVLQSPQFADFRA